MRKLTFVIFALAATLFVGDLLFPDPLPIIDEVLLGGITTIAGVAVARAKLRGGDPS